MANDRASPERHFTTRRGFITAAGFGVVSLYGLWAAYGAAPLPFSAHGDEHVDAGHAGGHGHGAPAGPAPDEFRAMAEAFVEANKLPDGSVQPRAPAPAHEDVHAAHRPAEHSAITARRDAEPVDVYIIAYQWGFTPTILRLAANARYRFRMMAVDVTHGAAIRLGAASRVMRLRTGALVEQELEFTRAGEYLVYCTSYCGILHDRMRGKIIVT